KPGRRARVLLVGAEQAIGMRLLQVSLDALRAQHPLVEGELVPVLDADDGVVLYLELQPTLLAAEAAMGLHEPVRLDTGVHSDVRRVGPERPEFPNRVEVERRHGRAVWFGRSAHG